MSSSIKLTNSSGKIVTITNPDTTSADVAVDLLNNAYTIATVDDFGTVPVGYTTVIVKDTDRGGTFIWSSTGTANDGTVFAGSVGYWVRQYSGAVNVRWFGAKGDGVTDDTAAIQAAIAVAWALMGTPRYTTLALHFPAGEYVVTANNWLGLAIPTNSTDGALVGYTITGDGRKNSLIRFKPSVADAYIYDQTDPGTTALLAASFENIGFVLDQTANGGTAIHGLRTEGVAGATTQLIRFQSGICYGTTDTVWIEYTGDGNEDNTIINDFHFFTGIKTLIKCTNSESLGHYVRNSNFSGVSGPLFEFIRGSGLALDGANIQFNASYSGEASILKTGYGTLSPGDSQQVFSIRNTRAELRGTAARVLYIDRQAYANIEIANCNFAGGTPHGQAIAIIPVPSKAKVTFRNCIFPDQAASPVTSGKIQMVNGRTDTDYSTTNAATSEVIFEGINFANIRIPTSPSYSLVDWSALTVASIYRTVSVVYRSCDSIPDCVEYGHDKKTGRTFRPGYVYGIPFRGETFPVGNGTSAPSQSAADFNVVVPLNNFVVGVEINRRSLMSWGSVSNYAIRVVDKTEYNAAGTGTVYGSTTAQAGNLAINQTIYINKSFTGSLDSRTLYLQIASGYAITGAGAAGTVQDGGVALRVM